MRCVMSCIVTWPSLNAYSTKCYRWQDWFFFYDSTPCMHSWYLFWQRIWWLWFWPPTESIREGLQVSPLQMVAGRRACLCSYRVHKRCAPECVESFSALCLWARLGNILRETVSALATWSNLMRGTLCPIVQDAGGWTWWITLYSVARVMYARTVSLDILWVWERGNEWKVCRVRTPKSTIVFVRIVCCCSGWFPATFSACLPIWTGGVFCVFMSRIRWTTPVEFFFGYSSDDSWVSGWFPF